MTGLPALAVVAALAAIVLGLPLGLYALLTRSQRQTMREIRRSALREGWEFHRSFFRGDPTEFEIHGRAREGIPWIMKCRGTTGYDRGWTVRLHMRFPSLAGDTDLAIMPRQGGSSDLQALASKATPKMIATIAKFSEAAAGAAEFLKDGAESPTGLAEFDSAYQVMSPKDRIRMPLVDAIVAKRLIEWPAETIKAHSILAWRDPSGLHIEARLPGPANWPTVNYFEELAEALMARVPPGSMPSETPGILDRLTDKF